jgi:hypothetical protein
VWGAPAPAMSYRAEFMRRMKKFRIILGVLLVVFLSWYVHSRIVQSQRDATYRQALTRFQRDLRLGTPRAQVETYLKSQQVVYSLTYEGGSGAWSFITRIGEEPSASIVCASWSVFITFDFLSSENKPLGADPSPTDTLKRMRIEKVGDCL